jgi:RNA recognition motif-containing protein
MISVNNTANSDKIHTSLFVGNIPYGALEAEIRDLFAAFGPVESVRFAMDHQRGRFRGFGFVKMPEPDARRALKQLDQAEFQGRTLIVKVARERRPLP